MQSEMEFEPLGERLRDGGIAQVLDHNRPWSVTAMYQFCRWIDSKPVGFQFIGEDFKHAAKAAGVAAPSHPNAWGGLFGRILSQFPNIKVVGLQKMKDPTSHARRSLLYRKVS